MVSQFVFNISHFQFWKIFDLKTKRVGTLLSIVGHVSQVLIFLFEVNVLDFDVQNRNF